jgi:arylsulfatase A-like enzyme
LLNPEREPIAMAEPTVHDRPNILLITLHDAGRYIGCYGVPTVRTPQIDRIAAAGLLFENAFSVSPKCSPSRSAVITGRYPHQNGVFSITHGPNAFRLHDGEARIGRLMSETGYATWLLGLQHEHDDPHDLGFAHVDVTFSITKAPAKLRDLLRQRDASRPFYCQVGCPEVHRPWDRGYFPESADGGVTVPGYLTDGPGTRRELAQLQGILQAVDHAIGEIDAALEEAGCRDNTLLVLTTDHGLPFARAKDTLYDAGTAVFLIMRGPGIRQPGRRVTGLVSQIDLFSTFLEMAGIPKPAAAATSESLLPCLTGDACWRREYIFSENNYSGGYDPIRAVRSRRFKYIRNFEANPAPSVAVDYALLPSHVEQGQRFLRSRRPVELYDLETDPDELHNLAEDPAYKAHRSNLEDRLFAWMAATGDPLMRGPLWGTAYHEAHERMQQWQKQRQQTAARK